MTVSPDNGFPGSFLTLRPSQLHVDARYQRGEHYARSKRIAADFHWVPFGALVVSKRKGSYFVIDGQHRCVAAIIAKKQYVPCVVFAGLAIEQEAISWVKINLNRKNPSQVDAWKARLSGKEDDTVEAQKILARYGYRVSTSIYKEGMAHVTVRCAGQMRALYQDGRLADTLHFLTACWPKHALLAKSSVIRGAAQFIALYLAHEYRVSQAKMLKCLKETAIDVIDMRARGLIQYGSSRSHVAAISAVMVDAYNKNKRGKARIPRAL